MGIPMMDARFAARMATGLSLTVAAIVVGMPGESLAQYYPPGQGAYPPAPPSGYSSSDPGYGRPAPSGIQSEALPPPPGGAPQGGSYQNGNASAPGRGGYSYGNWEPTSPPGGGQYNPNGGLPPGPGQQVDYASRPPMEITPPPGGAAPAPAGGYPPPPPSNYSPSGGYSPSGAYSSPGTTAYAPPGGGYSPAPGAGEPPAHGNVAGLPPEDQPEMGQPKELPPQFRRQVVDYPSNEPAGTIIIDTPNTYLYLILGGGKALRYGVGVGREGFTWAGREKITRMAEWPDWHPPSEMIDRQPYLPRFMAGGESNPLGARAMYLGATVYRIHGTNQPSTIGTFVSSGCIRLTNEDVQDLYSRVTVGTKVIVLPRRSDATASAAH